MTNERPLKKGDKIVGEFLIQDIFGGEGKSGMGVVYLVTSRKYDRPFVLKTFQKDNYNSIERFRSEAKVWVSTGIHQNIVQALFVDEINEKLFIGAEFIAPDEYGRNTITDFLKQGGTSNQNIVKWTAQFCYGMNQAISKGMKVHRDVKPDNLMVDANGNLKITDFGLSKFNNEFKALNASLDKTDKDKGGFLNKFKELFDKSKVEIKEIGLTNEGSFLGTILYASPEQIMNSSNIDFRSDIYSFGIVLYQLISLGSFPYSLVGKTTIETLALMHLQEPIVKINHPLASIAYKCLSRNANQRYQSLNELLEDLKLVADSLKIKLPANKIEIDAGLRELYIQSYTYRSLGDLKKAKELITKYINQDKTDSLAWSLKGRIEGEQGDIEEAIKSTLISYEIEPNNSQTCNNLGIFYQRNNNLPSAERFLYEAIEIDPYNTGALANSAILYEAKGNFPLAADLIVRAIELAPDKISALFNANNIGAMLIKKGEFEVGRKVFESLTKYSPKDTNAWFNLGLIYESKNLLIKAIKCYQEVEQIKPKDNEALIRLTKLLGYMAIKMEHLENLNLAIHYCNKLIEYEIEPLKAIAWKAQYIQIMGNGSEAIKILQMAIKYNPSSDSLFLTLANILGLENKNNEATIYLNKAKLLMEKNGNKTPENMSIIDELEKRLK